MNAIEAFEKANKAALVDLAKRIKDVESTIEFCVMLGRTHSDIRLSCDECEGKYTFWDNWRGTLTLRGQKISDYFRDLGYSVELEQDRECILRISWG